MYTHAVKVKALLLRNEQSHEVTSRCVWKDGDIWRCVGDKMNNLIYKRYYSGNSLAELRATKTFVRTSGPGWNPARVGPAYRHLGPAVASLRLSIIPTS